MTLRCNFVITLAVNLQVDSEEAAEAAEEVEEEETNLC